MMFLWSEHKAYNLYEKQDFFFRGSFFYNDDIYEIDNIHKIHDLIRKYDKNEVVNVVHQFNGNFLLGIKCSDDWMIFSDKIASFPLYWTCVDDEIIVSDSTVEIGKNKKMKFDELGLLEVASTTYTYGNRTIWEGVNCLGPGEYIEISLTNNYVDKRNYYIHSHIDENKHKRVDEYIGELGKIVDNVFSRLIKRLNGRQAVLFLSGGYDSRLICQQLSLKGYRNVLCVSLRSRDDLDVKVGKEIADHFGYGLVTVDYTSKMWKEKSNKPEFWEIVAGISNGVNIPYNLQGMVIKDLVDKKIIERNAVIMTGNSGDVVEGNDVFDVPSFKERYSRNQIKDKIAETHLQNIYSKEDVKKRIYKELEHVFYQDKYAKDIFTCEEAQDIYEYFNWYNRQCKYVTSDVRNYDDLSGNEWALPLWDDEFVQFWLKVPMELRYKRKLYYQYVNNDKLPTANIDTLFLKARRMFFKYFSMLWKWIYWIRMFVGLNGNNMLYCWAGVLTFKEKLEFLWKTRDNRTSAISAVMWKIFRIKYGIDIFREVTKYRM